VEVSLVTDEVSADPETAIELGVDWGVRNFELRGFGTERVPLFTDFHRARIEELKQEFDVKIVAISPGIFKCPFMLPGRGRFPLRTFDHQLYQQWRSGRELVHYHLEELLPRSIEYALAVGAGLIVIFSFERGRQTGGDVPDEIMETFDQAAQLAEQAGLQLVIEVEEGFWADTGAQTAKIVKAIARPSLAVNWDPANALSAGDNVYPKGYEAVRDWVRHVHFKDLVFTRQGHVRYEVEGEIPWEAQLRALHRDGYKGYISVETHMAPKVDSARRMTRRLQALIDKVTREDE
jgi:sugar phosphate isomerase/epimerase